MAKFIRAMSTEFTVFNWSPSAAAEASALALEAVVLLVALDLSLEVVEVGDFSVVESVVAVLVDVTFLLLVVVVVVFGSGVHVVVGVTFAFEVVVAGGVHVVVG